MKLHRLELAAFGPFADEHVVDLDTLAADGLFLLYGETGAGKSSVLDAIAYALFGVVPGPRQRANRLRCDRAEPGRATSVRLELTVAGRRVRVRRTPEWERPKRRGSGTTKEPARALLEEWRADRWVGLSTRVDEVSHQLRDWVGMSAEQFFQVVLLPQGEFARFLLAESKDREQLLERLFGTERFTHVQEWLAAQRAECRIAAEAAEATARRYLDLLVQVLGPDEDDDVTVAVEEVGTRLPRLADVTAEWRSARLGRARTAAEAAAAAVPVARAARDDLRRRAAGIRELAGRRDRLRELERERRELTGARDRVDRLRSELARARLVAPLMTVLATNETMRDRARAAAGSVADARDSADAALAGAGRPALGRSAPSPPEVVRIERELRAEAGRLVALGEREDELRRLLRAAEEMAAREAELMARLQAAGLERDRLPERIAGLEAEVTALAADAARCTDRTETVSRIAAQLAAARRAAAVAAEVPGLVAAAAAAVDKHQECTDEVQRLREQRLTGMAAELAGQLIAGRDCPVCGSPEHPRPARPAPAAVTVENERAAVRAQRAAAEQREAAAAALAAAREDVREHLAGSGHRPVDELIADHARAGTELAAAQRAADRLAPGQQRLATARAQARDCAELIAAARAEATELATGRAELAERIAVLDTALQRARGDCPTVADRRRLLLAAADALTTLATLAEEANAADRAAADAAAARDEQLSVVGFATATAVREAHRDPAWCAEAAAAIAAHEQGWAAVSAAAAEAGLDGPDAAAVLAAEVDPAAADRAEQEAEDALTAAVAAAAAAAHRHEEAVRLAAHLGTALAAAEPVRQRHAEVRGLADLVAGQGQNTRNMTLRAYVLAARLAEVADAASSRLREMSGGRYTFAHSERADSQRVRAGLGLVVVDDYSGLARPTRTLSGGETFLASLALALGLADVVTAEAGGVRLDTLFIDEGFGSLDAGTLDDVMSALDELRAGGRVVGVVSHVEEMRARIPRRLHVVKRRSGSALTQAASA